MSSSSLDTDMTEDKATELLHETIMQQTSKIAVEFSTTSRQRRQHRSYIDHDRVSAYDLLMQRLL
jgi:hypothetical protein